MILSPKSNRWILLGLLLGAASATACDRASDEERKANAAADEANEKIARATKEADEKIAAANGSFLKMREDFRHATTTKLVDLDRDVEALAARAKQASGQDKADLDARLSQCRALRAAFAADYELLEVATGAAWDNNKARLDKELLDLRAVVDGK